jgi:hypothetical protein
MNKIFTLLLAGLTFSQWAFSQTTLAAGDIAFIAIATDAPDRFAFILLKDVTTGTAISFTDNTWLNGTALATNESTATWTANSSLTAGTIITITDPNPGTNGTVTGGGTCVGNLNGLSADGDQILAYQGTSSSPTFIAGISSESWAATCNASTGGALNNLSCLPSVLTDGTNGVSLTTSTTEIDNGFYNGITTGTVAQLRAAINNRANWTLSDVNQTWPSWSFTLPVELISFKVQAKSNTIQLNWLTASEKDNAHFNIQRSSNGRDFQNIGQVKGAGNSQSIQKYQYTDDAPAAGLNYYRLEQVDFDGTTAVSPTKSIVYGKNGKWALSNTVAKSEIMLVNSQNTEGVVSAEIVDVLGRPVQQINLVGETTLTVNVAQLTAGHYFVRIGNEVLRFIKQ